MASVHDVAKYVLEKQGTMTAMKLEKLVYYAKAWHLVWESESLFPESIQAWANGPVSPELYKHHRGEFKVREWERGDVTALQPKQVESIDNVLKFYGPKSAFELSDMTHSERPWREARGDTPIGQRSVTVITDGAMFEYYDGLVGSDQG